MKKFLAIILSAVMILSSFAFADEYESEYPRIIFENKTSVMKVKAGDEIKLALKVRNVGAKAARDITIKSTSKDAPVYWETAVDTYNISRMSAGGSRDINIDLVVKETADVGVYALPFSIEYVDNSSSKYTTDQTVYFEVIEENAKPQIIVRNVNNAPSTISAGSENKLSFEIFNAGELLARRINLKLTGLAKDGFMVKDGIDIRYFESIEGGVSERVSFDLLVSENITKGTNVLNVELSYKDQDNTAYTETKNIYFNNVQGTEGVTGKGTPKIIISSYDLNPSNIVAGGKTQFDFTFKNTHLTKKITNLKAVVSCSDGTLIIENGSNSFYVQKVEPQEEIVKSFSLRAKQDALSGAYPVAIAFDYEDADGTAFNTTETINLPVVEKTKLSIDNVNSPSEIYVDSTGYVSFEYYNKGKATISNLSVTVEGDYSPKAQTTYIGNVEAGKGSYSEVEVTANVGGEAKGTLVFSFEDSVGNILTERREFTGTVFENTPMDQPTDMPMDDMPKGNAESGIPWWQLTLIGLGCFLVTTIIVRLITIKVKMKKIEDEI